MSPQKKIGLFLGFTLFFSTLSNIPILRAGTIAVQDGLFVLTMMWSPGLAALLTQLIANRSLRGLGWRPGPIRWLGLALILPLLYGLPVYLFTWLSGLGSFVNPYTVSSVTRQYASPDLLPALAFFLLYTFTVDMLGPLILALGEEIGWRGLLVPELSKVTSFSKTALISGVIWAAWHMPAIFFADLEGEGLPDLYAAAAFAILLIALSFAFAWLRLKSGSLWTAVLLHASHNQVIIGFFDRLTGETAITPYITGEFGVGLAFAGLVVAFVFWRMQRDRPLSLPLHRQQHQVQVPDLPQHPV